MGHQFFPHGLVALPLLKGVAGAVPVLVEGEAAAGKFLLHKVLNNGLLVFNRDIFLIQLIVHRDAGVSRNIKGLDHGLPPPFRYRSMARSNSEM